MTSDQGFSNSTTRNSNNDNINIEIRAVDPENPSSTLGKGLFTKQAVTPKDLLCSVDHPVLSALDFARLEDTCYTCHAQPGNSAPFPVSSATKPPVSLKLCTRCQTVRFCDRACQAAAWRAYHRFECPVYASLVPRVLPAIVRAVMRFVLQREHGALGKGVWEEVWSLEGHENELLQKSGRREDFTLMARGTVEYSKAKIDQEVVVGLFCRLSINAFTLMTPWNDPLGIALHPLLARINHSCRPNAFIRFCSPSTSEIQVIPLRSIAAHTEITISYIDTTDQRACRREQLSKRYFFECFCRKCRADADKPCVWPVEVDAMIQAAEDPRKSKEARVDMLHDALRLVDRSHPSAPWAEMRVEPDPHPRIHHALTLAHLDLQQYRQALAHAFVTYFTVDPVYYERAHPLRLVHTLVLISLIKTVMDAGETGSKPDVFIFADLKYMRRRTIAELRNMVGGVYDGDSQSVVLELVVEEALREGPERVDVDKRGYKDMEHMTLMNAILAWAWKGTIRR